MQADLLQAGEVGQAVAREVAEPSVELGLDWRGAAGDAGVTVYRNRVRDLFNGTELGSVDAKANTLRAGFTRFLLLQATPETPA